ncbi:MAG: glycine--tRNA ligase subunit beta, partial [Alphaproteobacteria bacterium]|nr:glycine--tRNA ligase subunit beta [Alphaproteobacteria bacterium]
VFNENQDDLCKIYKADLVSSVVVEIPELQGIMGYYYAKHEGIDLEVALAIKNQYKPQGAGDSLPENLLGAKLALLDKLDSLIEFFRIGKKPSGSKDPFALRRAAIGIIRIIEGFSLDMDLSWLSVDVQDFLKERLEVYLSANYSLEAIHSAFDESFNIYKIITNVAHMDSLLKSADGVAVMGLAKRVANILKSQDMVNVALSESLLKDSTENNLYKLIIATNLSSDLSQNIKNLAKLKEPTDLFLDTVQINMSESIEVKNNRIKLLSMVAELCAKILK